MTDLVTFGETMARLENPVVGPMRHARSLDLGIGGAESNTAIGLSYRRHRRLVRPRRRRRVRPADHHRALRRGRPARPHRGGRDRADRAAVQGAPLGHAHPRPVLPDGQRRVAAVPVGRPARVDPVRARPARHRHHRRHQRHRAPGLDDAIETARDAGVPVSLDVNYRAALWTPAEAGECLHNLVKRADLVFATEEEARLIVPGDDPAGLATALAALGPRDVLVKRGAAGVVASCEDGCTCCPRTASPSSTRSARGRVRGRVPGRVRPGTSHRRAPGHRDRRRGVRRHRPRRLGGPPQPRRPRPAARRRRHRHPLKETDR